MKFQMRININVEVGRLVKYFVISDLFFLAGWGFVDPIFSIFIIKNIAGATIVTAGVAAGIYWILKSSLEIPIANYLDRTRGEKDDFIALIAGLFLAGVSAISFAWVTQIWQLYLLQIIHALAFALYLSAWPTIFSRHLDKDRISFDWALDSTVGGIAAGVTGLLGGWAAEQFGFASVFVAAGILSFAAGMILVAVPDLILPKPTSRENPEDKTPGTEI